MEIAGFVSELSDGLFRPSVVYHRLFMGNRPGYERILGPWLHRDVLIFIGKIARSAFLYVQLYDLHRLAAPLIPELVRAFPKTKSVAQNGPGYAMVALAIFGGVTWLVNSGRTVPPWQKKCRQLHKKIETLFNYAMIGVSGALIYYGRPLLGIGALVSLSLHMFPDSFDPQTRENGRLFIHTALVVDAFLKGEMGLVAFNAWPLIEIAQREGFI